MRKVTLIGLTIVFLAGGFFLACQLNSVAAGKAPAAAATQNGIAVYFSPNGGCTDAVVAEIGKARKSIRMQAYSFTSAPIAKALIEAKKRGVDIIAVLDKSQKTEKYSSATFLLNEGVLVLIDSKHAIAHNKITQRCDSRSSLRCRA